MPAKAVSPFDFGYFLEMNPNNTSSLEDIVLWERGLDAMSWGLDEVMWSYWTGEQWKDTLYTDSIMSKKLLVEVTYK